MSNTDGEDTQHLKEVLSQLELIAYEVWLDHTTSGKNLYKKFKVNDMKTAIEAARKLIQNDTTLYSQEVIDSYQEELASLREQLKQERNKAIYDAIQLVTCNDFSLISQMVKALEKLKDKSHE